MKTQPIESTEKTSVGAAKTSDVSAQIWTPENSGIFTSLGRGTGGTAIDKAFPNPALGTGGAAADRALVQPAGVEIVPCTPPGKDPLKDPANPAAPNYDAQTFGPKPEKPSIPQSGIITPDQLPGHNPLGTILPPNYGPYSGECKVIGGPEEDTSKIPMY